MRDFFKNPQQIIGTLRDVANRITVVFGFCTVQECMEIRVWRIRFAFERTRLPTHETRRYWRRGRHRGVV